jgi:hypothetical protein
MRIRFNDANGILDCSEIKSINYERIIMYERDEIIECFALLNSANDARRNN